MIKSSALKAAFAVVISCTVLYTSFCKSGQRQRWCGQGHGNSAITQVITAKAESTETGHGNADVERQTWKS